MSKDKMELGKFNVIKLKLVLTRFTVNGNTVICECVYAAPAMPFIEASNGTKYPKLIKSMINNMGRNEKNEPHFMIATKGIAKCHPNDTFNEKTGKSIAFSKAYIEAHKKFYSILKISEAALQQKYNDIFGSIIREDKILSLETLYLNKITNGQSKELGYK